MKPIQNRELSTIKQFEQLEEKQIKVKGESIVTRLLADLNDNKKAVSMYELDWREYSGLQRHVKLSMKKKQTPLLRVKVIDFDGNGLKRRYKVAIAKTGRGA